MSMLLIDLTHIVPLLLIIVSWTNKSTHVNQWRLNPHCHLKHSPQANIDHSIWIVMLSGFNWWYTHRIKLSTQIGTATSKLNSSKLQDIDFQTYGISNSLAVGSIQLLTSSRHIHDTKPFLMYSRLEVERYNNHPRLSLHIRQSVPSFFNLNYLLFFF